jgi:acetolactate decarboxylase
MQSKQKAALTESIIYLCSPVNALVEGIYEENVQLSEVLKHGDFGLGTFDDLDGEMVILDGRIYQISSDGQVTQVDTNVHTPFAAVTFYAPVHHKEINLELPYNAFLKWLKKLFISPNLFYAIRIEGEFTHIKARSVPKQANYHPFVDVTHEQTVFDYNNIGGTLAGFFTPAFLSSLSVPGLHLHFLSSDLRHGGHVLECIPHKARVGIQLIHKLELSLPMTSDYLKLEFHRNIDQDLNETER